MRRRHPYFLLQTDDHSAGIGLPQKTATEYQPCKVYIFWNLSFISKSSTKPGKMSLKMVNVGSCWPRGCWKLWQNLNLVLPKCIMILYTLISSWQLYTYHWCRWWWCHSRILNRKEIWAPSDIWPEWAEKSYTIVCKCSALCWVIALWQSWWHGWKMR